MKSSRIKSAISKISEVKELNKKADRVTWKAELGDKVVEWVESFGDNVLTFHCYLQSDKSAFNHQNDGWYGFFPKTLQEAVKWFKGE